MSLALSSELKRLLRLSLGLRPELEARPSPKLPLSLIPSLSSILGSELELLPGLRSELRLELEAGFSFKLPLSSELSSSDRGSGLSPALSLSSILSSKLELLPRLRLELRLYLTL